MKRTATAVWTGDLKAGQGNLTVGSGAFSGEYSFSSRFEEVHGMNPEELLGAAHAGCFSMALSSALANAGHIPTRVETTATVELSTGENGPAISNIALRTRGIVPGISQEVFERFAEETRVGCIISRALSAVPMSVEASLE